MTTDEAAQLELAAQVEAQLVDDAFGMSIFQLPEVLAYNSTYVSGADVDPVGADDVLRLLGMAGGRLSLRPPQPLGITRDQ